MATITSSNPFELLGDGPISKPTENKTQSQKPKSKSNLKSNPTPSNKAPTKTKTVTVDDLIQKDKDSRPRGGSRGRGSRGNRGAVRGRGNSDRGRHGGFDKRSASGRQDTKRAENAGWGEEKKDYEKEEIKPETVSEEVTKNPEEKEESNQTYEEYLVAKAQKALNISTNTVRVANEGSDDSKWKDGKKIEKKDETFYNLQPNHKPVQKKTEKKPTKVHLQFEAKFYSPPTQSERSPRDRNDRSRGDSRGRGQSRGGRGNSRGGDRPSRVGRVEKIDDPKSFPALGSQ